MDQDKAGKWQAGKEKDGMGKESGTLPRQLLWLTSFSS